MPQDPIDLTWPRDFIWGSSTSSYQIEGAARERGATRYLLAGNIPYHLTSPILFRLPGLERCRRAVIMMQREVGELILASPGSRNCGILTVFLGSYLGMRRVARVRPGAFRPPPAVESVVLYRTTEYDNPPAPPPP